MLKTKIDVFGKLSETQREILTLRLRDRLSANEIARRKRIPLARVQAIVSEALRKYWELLQSS